ncbi:hypothetical protein ABZ726_17945, partial [Streptomyces hundungensis]
MRHAATPNPSSTPGPAPAVQRAQPRATTPPVRADVPGADTGRPGGTEASERGGPGGSRAARSTPAVQRAATPESAPTENPGRPQVTPAASGPAPAVQRTTPPTPAAPDALPVRGEGATRPAPATETSPTTPGPVRLSAAPAAGAVRAVR